MISECVLYTIYTTYITIFIVDMSTYVKTIVYQIYIPTVYSIAKFLKKNEKI
jgi:hypothetical protein